MKTRIKISVSVIGVILAGVFYNNCSGVKFGGFDSLEGTTGVGNPLTRSIAVATAMCSKIAACNPEGNTSSCYNSVLNLGGVTASLGLSTSSYPTLSSSSDAEVNGRLTANSAAVNSCAATIANLSCSAPSVSSAFNANAANPYASAGQMLAAANCWQTFAPTTASCGMQSSSSSLAFCETFDTAYPVTGRSGQLNSTLWGVARSLGAVNIGQGQFNAEPETQLQTCSGTAVVSSPNDVIICNGQLREATNDNAYGVSGQGGVTSLAMYPKQPFDFTNRTGTVSFDVSNDSTGSHGVWPELWVTDSASPDPFVFSSSTISAPQNAFGVRFAAAAPPGDPGLCPNNKNSDKYRWTVDSAVAVRNYIIESNQPHIPGQSDSLCQGSAACVNTGMTVTILDCVTQDPSGPSGALNHIELKVSQNEIDVYASDAGNPSSLRIIAMITNANLNLSRGHVWLKDMHNNADEAGGPRPSQRQHTFAWDNVAFDGPLVARDLSFAARDNTQVNSDGSQTWNGWPTINLGLESGANQTASWDIQGVSLNPNATSVKVLFNFYPFGQVNNLNVTVNGHAHSTPWPYPESQQLTWRTLAVTIPISDLVAGTNVVQLGSDQPMVSSNVDIFLEGAGGLVTPK